MRKIFKIILFVFLAFNVLIIGLISYLFIATANVKLDSDKLININKGITFFDRYGTEINELYIDNEITTIDKIPTHTKNAFIAIEDKRFYSHNGIDVKRLFGSLFNNIKSFSFKEGASTISQQLIKNTHLSSEKTLLRKVSEIKLALKLEKKYSKDEILEKYLNTIYFGDNKFGITAASKYYFNKTPSQLSINESAILASIIKAPNYYSPLKDENRCLDRKNLVLSEMFKQGYISESEYESGINENLTIHQENTSKSYYNVLHLSKSEFDNEYNIKNQVNKNVEIITSADMSMQNIIENVVENNRLRYDWSIVLMNAKSEVLAYYSTCGNANRQIGSLIKPLLVYGPAIELDHVTPYTKINDAKHNFNGYCPSNFKDVYYGDVSVKFSLAKSLNTCSVKLLNSLGISKALSYFNKFDIQLSNTDNSLALALGATEHGAKLTDVAAAYGVFLNNGNYSPQTSIRKIRINGKNYKNSKQKQIKVFSSDTTFLMNDMLRYTVTDGTAKKLSYNKAILYAKTGTVGTKNGNLDAYVISYNKDYILGCWIGKKDGTNMENTISGGTLPTKIASEIWDEIYKDKVPPHEFEQPRGIEKIKIDKISYDEDNIIILADVNAPERYNNTIFVKTKNVPKNRSTRFSSPKITKPKLLVNKKGILIQLCLSELDEALIYRESNNKKILIYDTLNNSKEYFLDTNLEDNVEYHYSVIPYKISYNGCKIYGNEMLLNKVKPSRLPDGWWNNELD